MRVQPFDLKDPEKKVKYVKDSYKHYSVHQSSFMVEREEDIDYAVFLAKQVHEKFLKTH